MKRLDDFCNSVQHAALRGSVFCALMAIGALGMTGCVSTGSSLAPNDYSDSAVFTVYGTSMTPTYKPGDYIVTERVPFDELKERDIVVFWYAGSSFGEPFRVVHRIHAIDHRRSVLVAKGDNSAQPDRWLIPAKDVIGRVGKIIARTDEAQPDDVVFLGDLANVVQPGD